MKRRAGIDQRAVLWVNKAVIVSTAEHLLFFLQMGHHSVAAGRQKLSRSGIFNPSLSDWRPSFLSPPLLLARSAFRPIKSETHCRVKCWLLLSVWSCSPKWQTVTSLRVSSWMTSGWRSRSSMNVLLIAELTKALWVTLPVLKSFSHPSAQIGSLCFSFSLSFRMTSSTACRW